MPAQPTSLILYVSLRLPRMTWTLCLENGNNELLICWLSVFEKRKSLKTFCILKQFGWSSLLLFFLFSYISLQASVFTALGIGNINWIFRVKGRWPSLEKSQKALKKTKVVWVAFEVCDAKQMSQSQSWAIDKWHSKKLDCHDCGVMLCVWEEVFQF